ncbi:MAG: copper transporter [Actinobacteria bacterium]|nr:copper transporter [Actinomycetota bacterium]
MIDFRYHLVSLVSVFLALAIGLVLGATALKPLVVSGLQATANRERVQIDQLITTGKLTQQQLAREESFARSAEPQVLAHLLAGQRVVMVTAAGAPGSATSGITTALTEAGATVSGQVQLQSRFFDTTPATRQALSQLAQQLAPPTMNLPSGSAVLQASRVLASALVTRDGPGQPAPGVPDAAGGKILSGLAHSGFLTVGKGTPAAPATLAVVVLPASPPGTSDANPVSEGLVTLAQQLNLAGQGTVVAGTVAGSGPGSAIDVMRAGGRSGHLSSVDNADMVIGQIAAAQALYELLHGVYGSYGVGSGASGPGPSPLPTPSASTSPHRAAAAASGSGGR